MQKNNFISVVEQSWPSKPENHSGGLFLSQNIKLFVLLGEEFKIKEERDNALSVNQEEKNQQHEELQNITAFPG